MPTYDYVCRACGHRVEIHHGLYAEQPTQCPKCHSHALRKAIAAPAIVFKGSGWAKKDRSAGTSTKATRDSTGSDTGSSSGGEGGDTSKGGAPATGDEAAKGSRPSTSGTDPTTAGPASSGGSSAAPGVD
jgi:putative FmdB family regulatory protein